MFGSVKEKPIKVFVPEAEHDLKTNTKKTDMWAKLGIDSGSFGTSVGIWGLLQSLALQAERLLFSRKLIAQKGKKR